MRLIPNQQYEWNSPPRTWGATTDPRQHNPAQFRYLVHALNSLAKGGAVFNYLTDLKSGASISDPTHGDQSIDLAMQPERVAERVTLSMSLITQDHLDTWGEVGLIIEVPEQNILLTSTQDAGTPNSSIERIAARKAPLIDPDSLLAGSIGLNEVVAVANGPGGPVRLVGIFAKKTSDGRFGSPYLAQMFQGHAERLGLPFVELPYVSRLHEKHESVVFYSGGIAVRRGTYTFQLPLPGVPSTNKTLFKKYDERWQGHWISPDEYEACVEMVVRERPDVDSQALRRLYTEADAARTTPTIEWTDNGENIRWISYHAGYGDGITKFIVDPSGYAACWKLADAVAKSEMQMVGSFESKPNRHTAVHCSGQRNCRRIENCC